MFQKDDIDSLILDTFITLSIRVQSRTPIHMKKNVVL